MVFFYRKCFEFAQVTKHPGAGTFLDTSSLEYPAPNAMVPGQASTILVKLYSLLGYRNIQLLQYINCTYLIVYLKRSFHWPYKMSHDAMFEAVWENLYRCPTCGAVQEVIVKLVLHIIFLTLRQRNVIRVNKCGGINWPIKCIKTQWRQWWNPVIVSYRSPVSGDRFQETISQFGLYSFLHCPYSLV